MTTVVISPANVANFAEGGGHFWVYMQYVEGLRRLGCDVYWLERFRRSGNRERDDVALSSFFQRMERYGLRGKVLLYDSVGSGKEDADAPEYIGVPAAEATALFRRADLLLNFHYAIEPAILGTFARTALVDIDPGLLQFWIAAGQLAVPRHDHYFTTGETVGTPDARFPDCGLAWVRVHPPISLNVWPVPTDSPDGAFSTVSSWWGGGAKGKAEWVVDGAGTRYDNCKRVSFLEFAELPRLTAQPLELALNLSEDAEDVADRQLLEQMGWRVRHSREVAATPEAYRAYIQHSRGEFSCAKPSCMRFQNAWVSDRTLCYLASGRPAVVQHTGPSTFLPNGYGLFRFSTSDEAAAALAAIDADYERHRRAAREIAETYFDARPILTNMLQVSLQ